MAETALSVAEQTATANARRRAIFWVAVAVAVLVLLDVSLSLFSFGLSYVVRQHASVLVSSGGIIPFRISKDFEPYFTLLLFVPLVKVFALRKYGLYRLRGEFSFSDDLVRITKAATLSFLVLVLIAFLFRQGFSIEDGRLTKLDFSYSRLVFVYDWLASIALFWVTRSSVRLVQTLQRRRGRNLIPTVVVGCGDMAQVCVGEMSEKPHLGYKLVGVVRGNQVEDSSAVQGYGVRLLGDFDRLPELVKRYGIEEVLITDTQINPGKMFEVLMECGRDHHIKYRVVPNLFDCMPGKTEVATLGTLPMIKLYEEPLRGPQRAVKRGMDVLAAMAVLLVTWPLWVAVAIMIKLESRGPVFLKQERV